MIAQQRNHRTVLAWAILCVLAAWATIAYLFAPWVWKVYFRYHGAPADMQSVTRTVDGHPGDPVNIGLAGTERQIVSAMTAIGWYPADPITFRSSARIVVDSILRRPDDAAPVSNLYLFDRKQDLAFEQPVGNSPRQRHHVRFWRSIEPKGGLPLWFGAATFDTRVGLSHTTGEVTHHIAADVDAERNRLAEQLERAGWAQAVSWIDDFHRELEGRNGGGDPWRTDGRLVVVDLKDTSESPANKRPEE
jgi:hypothetical protein